jgi:hypothetical protein
VGRVFLGYNGKNIFYYFKGNSRSVNFEFGENIFIEMLILFASKESYINADDFLKFAYAHIEEYERILDEETYLSLLSANTSNKESINELISKLRTFISKNYADPADEIANDAYVERVAGSKRTDDVARCIQKLYIRRDKAQMDLKDVTSRDDLIKLIKQTIILPSWCGDGWDAMNDIFGAGDFPLVLEVQNMDVLEKSLPEDAQILKKLLSRDVPDYCKVKYYDDSK